MIPGAAAGGRIGMNTVNDYPQHMQPALPGTDFLAKLTHAVTPWHC